MPAHEVGIHPLYLSHASEERMSLAHPWSRNYNHWLVDVFFDWLVFTDYYQPEKVKEVFLERNTHPVPPYMPEILERAGLADRTKPFPYNFLAHDLYRSTTTELINPYRRSGQFHPSAVERWRKFWRLSDAPATSDEVLVVVRKPREGKALSRSLVNWDGERLARPRKEVVLEDLTVAEQVRLFASHRFVVGTHGAGLTNLLWSPPGTRVVEIVGKGVFQPSSCYRWLCGLRRFPLMRFTTGLDGPDRGHLTNLRLQPGAYDYINRFLE